MEDIGIDYFKSIDKRIKRMKKNKRDRFIFRKIQNGKIHICRNVKDWTYICGVRADAPVDETINKSAIVYESIKLSPKLVFPGVCRRCLKIAIKLVSGKVEKLFGKPKTKIDELFDDLIAGL